MTDYRHFFRGKRVTLMGLGLLGRGVGDAQFLAEAGAELIITDLKSKKELAASLEKLRKYKNIKYRLGEHNLADFKDRDFILKSAGVKLDSPFIKEARKNKIPIEMSSSLFAKLSGISIIGITGTRGKSTVTHLLAEILKRAGKDVLLGGNVRGVSTLQLFKKASLAESRRAKRNSLAVLELDSWQLQGFGEDKISPKIAIFTTFFDDHLNYYNGNRAKYFKDKANIFKFQKSKDVLVVGEGVYKKFPKNVKKGALIARVKDLPKDWKLKIPGEHNRFNAECAVLAARAMKIPEKIIRAGVENFKGIEGRLEFVRDLKGVKIYNDNNSTTPEATIAALRAVGDKKKRKVVLILGGDNKNLDMSELVQEIPKWCSKVVLFKEKGTDLIRDKVFKFKKIGIEVYEERGLPTTVKRAYKIAKTGETILYSPAFSSFGKYFKNEYDRGDQFLKIVKKLK